jgi:starvation-inducible DNA-binding protein
MQSTKLTPFQARLGTPSDLSEADRARVGLALLPLSADVLALYVKIKNYHWHVSGSHYSAYHELLDEHAAQVFAYLDVFAERARKLGQPALRSAGQVSRATRVPDDDRDYVEPHAMFRQLVDDNRDFASRMRELHSLCDEVGDVATASQLETFIDETERRIWFLYETAVGGEHTL